VYFAEGGDFVLAAGGQRTVYRPDSIGEGGFSLHEGDILQTGPGSFVEIRLMPRDMVIKAAENTSLAYHVGGNGVSLDLDYGRIRLSQGEGGEGRGEPVVVRAGTAEFIFRRGDMGLDYMVVEGALVAQRDPVLRAYVFSGAADLIPLATISPEAGASAGAVVFPISPMEMVALEIKSPLSYVERRPLDSGIINYWNRHKPAGFSPVADSPAAAHAANAPAVEAPAAKDVPPRQVLFIPPDYQPFFRTNKIKNGFIVGGTVLFLLGAGMESFAWFMNFDRPETKGILMNTGYGFFGLGLLSLGAALFINPRLPVSDGAE
jgi:hypothetical protein